MSDDGGGFLTKGAFTSTLTDREHHLKGINLWTVIITAVFFFMILSWYNFWLAFYNYITGYNPTGLEDYNLQNCKVFYATLGFASFWTVMSIGIYYLLDSYKLISGSGIDTHPLLRDQGRDLMRVI